MGDPTNSASPRTLLFTDLRHIRCGDLEWVSPEGEKLPVVGPPEPQVEAVARQGFVPRGVRLVAEPATKGDSLPKGNRFGRVIRDGGLYRSWYLDVAYAPEQSFGSYSAAPPLSVAIGVSESSDGMEWKERSRCSIEVPGQTSFDGFTFFVDPNGSPEERYKAVYTARPPEDEWPARWAEYQKVHPRHRDLRMNVRDRRAGEVRVGLVGCPGRAVADCAPIVGDHLSHPVHWQGQSDIGVRDGERVMLHFKLRSAELFAAEWT